MKTAFFWDERCFWHGGGNYAFMLPIGGLVQPMATGGLPENPETKRRLKNLIDVTGLSNDLHQRHADAASWDDLCRIHPVHFLQKFKDMSDNGGGELGLRTPFAQGGFELAALSAGLAKGALFSVLKGEAQNAYALSRPPGHHCLPEYPERLLPARQYCNRDRGSTRRPADRSGRGDRLGRASRQRHRSDLL